MKNKAALIPFIIVGLTVTLTCKRWTQVGTDAANDQPKTLDPRAASFTLTGKEWSRFDLDGSDIDVELPGAPSDNSPEMPESYKSVFSAISIHAYDSEDFASSFSEPAPTGKRKFEIKDLADKSMTALKNQIRDLKYTLDVRSETNALYNGTFTRNGKSYELKGCCVYKGSKPARVWAVLTLIPKDNADAQTAAQRIMESVVFEDSVEKCN